jgi:hypothetical protein
MELKFTSNNQWGIQNLLPEAGIINQPVNELHALTLFQEIDVTLAQIQIPEGNRILPDRFDD